MNNPKIMILSAAALVMLSMLLFLARFLLRKIISKKPEGEAITLASGIWFSTFFLSGTILISKTIFVFIEVVDIFLKINPADAMLNDFKTGSFLSGLTMLWLTLWYFLTNTLTIIITGKRNTVEEAQVNNYIHFLIRGIIHLGFIICLLPAFEMMLRTFIPHIEVPFYR